MSTLLAVLLSLSMNTAPKPTPFAAGTDLTIELGGQGGGAHTPDGVRLGIGMLTARTGSRRWAYELGFVSGDNRCRDRDWDRDCDEWAIYGFGGIQLDFPISGDRKLFASLTGGFFAGVSVYEDWYWDDRDYHDDDVAIMGGVMGKGALMYEFDAFRLGLGIFAGFGPSIGSESGLEIYFPAGLHFIFHFMF
jgi:hypothetical protein